MPERWNALAEQSPFATLSRSFDVLCRGPYPLAVDGTEFPGDLPARGIPLTELRDRVLDRSCSYELRDAVVTAVVLRARHKDGAWMVGAAGMVLPGMRRLARPLVRRYRSRAADIESDMLTGLIEAIHRTDCHREGVAARLVWAARHAAERTLVTEHREQPAENTLLDARVLECTSAGRHPDFVLARAVTAGIVQADDAELIGTTRFGQSSLQQAATDRGISYSAAHVRRRRAELALAAWLHHERFVENDTPRTVKSIENAPMGRSRGGRPRQGHGADRPATTDVDMSSRQLPRR